MSIDSELTPRRQALIAGSIERVFKTGEIDKLSGPAYSFIIQKMSHIAHFSLHGFKDSYADLRNLATSLQTSEYSQDREYMTRWARELRRREEFNCADLIDRIVAIVRKYEADTIERFFKKERDNDLAEARRLAAKWGRRIFS